MVRVVRLERTVSWSQTRRDTNFAIPGYSISAIIPRRGRKSKIFLSVVIPVVKAAFVPFSATGKNLLSPVSQGFAAFRLAPSRIQPQHSQSRRATSCATPGYFVILSGRSYSPKSSAIPTSLHPDIHFPAMIPQPGRKRKLAPHTVKHHERHRNDTHLSYHGAAEKATAGRRFSAPRCDLSFPPPAGQLGGTSGSVTSARNRSASMDSRNVPPIRCTRLRAMESPSPLPSVWREVSPRTKRSISSSGEMFSSARDTFLKLMVICPSAVTPDT